MRREPSGQLVMAANQNIKEKEYWLEKFSGDLDRAGFPYDYREKRTPADDDIIARLPSVGIDVTGERFTKLMALSKGSDYTLNLILITAVTILLSKYSGSSDIVLGMPIYIQENEDGDNRDFINRVLALRNQLEGHMTVKQLLLQVRRTITEAVEHLNYPIEILVEQLGLYNISTLFDAAVIVKNIHHKKDIESIRPNILFSFERDEQIIEGQLEYNPLLYREDTIERIGSHFQHVLQGMLGNPDGEICRIDLLSEEEKHKLLEEFNDTRTDYPGEKTICQLFEEQVERTPDHIAVVGYINITYRELNQRSNRLARVLIEKGVSGDAIVAITGNASIETIIGILGILKAGGAYLPVDTDYPEERKQYMLQDSNVRILLSEVSEVIELNEELPTHLTQLTQLCYVLYTSGSTGRPRGVMVDQRNVVRLVKNTNFITFEIYDRILQTGALEFDASTFEIWGSLLNGLTLCLLDRNDLVNPVKLKAAIQKSSASIMWMTSPLFNRMVQEDVEIFNGLKKLLVGGDVLSPPHIEKVKKAYPHLDVINGYGPTENTTFSATHLIDLPVNGSIPIGKPIANSTVYIADSNMCLQPIGVAGELYVGGDGVARGYLNNPGLTAEKFIYRSYRSYRTYSSNKIYKTGDLARWLADGTIEFLGRWDFQVKIRGFRIELEEIENHLLKHPRVKEAVVIDRAVETGEKYLCAYIVLASVESGETPTAPTELREWLSGLLPDYMVPSYFVPLETVPLTANGKVDRRALPEPVLPASVPYAAPTNDIEEKLVEIWSGVLGRGIGIDDNFFEIGGHSLKATNVISQVHKHFEVNIELRDFFSHPTIREVANMIREAEVRTYEEIQPLEELEYYDLSYAQRRLWILCQFEADSAAYNIPGMFPLSGAFDVKAFKQAVQTMVDRHEILRTVFATIDGKQKQKILKNLTFNLEESDLRCLDASTREIEAQRIYNMDAERVFDLENGPLFCLRYVRLEDKKCLVVFVIHHIISDGWSQGVIANEVLTAYNGKSLPPMKLQYSDYTHWHNTMIAGDHYNKAQQFWLEKFKDKPNGIELPTDHPRKPVQTFNGRRLPLLIDREIISKLHQVRQQEDATLFMGLLSLLNIFLYKYTGEPDIIVGAPIAGRRQPELHNMIGFLVNTLVYRNRVMPEENLRDHLSRVRKETLACYDYQDYPFDLLVDQLELDRDLSQSPLFNVMLAHNNADTLDRELTMKGMSVTGFPQTDDFNMSKFDLTFFMDEVGDRVFCRLEYNSDLFERSTIQRMADNFLYLVKELVENSDTPICKFHALQPGEYQRVLYDFNDTGCSFPVLTVQELLQQQVEKTPEKTAVVFRESDKKKETVSYKELNQKSNQLAHYLRNRYQVKPNNIVGISVDRSIDMIAAVLGVIKSGAGYAAIDPNYPEDRVLHMLDDSRCQLVIRDRSNPGLFDNYNGEIIVLPTGWNLIKQEPDSNPEIINTPADILYVIYTSGTTGTPNGAVLTHGILYNLVQWQKENTSIDASLRCLQFTTISFCVSFQEIMITLASAGELHLIGDIERQDVEYLMRFLSTHDIELLYLPFSYLNFLFSESERWGENFKHSLKHIVTAGEQLKVTFGLKDFLERNPHIQLHNHYGSSEMHVVTSYTLDASTAGRYPVPPAGKPIANTKIYILDDYFNPVPIGVWGEIFVEGCVEVAGYINNRDLSENKLVSIPPVTGNTGKLYRSGDVGRWLDDGNIEFKGRKDSQVKIRGFRVELSEIESRLLALDRVKECVVVVLENRAGQKELFAYVVLDGIETAEIKKMLGLYLPQHMMPRFIVLDNLPLMPNGKVDREALPKPDTTVQERETYAAPRNALEEKLAEIWAHLLGIDKSEIGIDDNFFELGGHSLKATTMVSRLHKEFDVRVQLLEIFRAPTMRDLAEHIKKLSKDIHTSINTVEKKEYYPLSSAQERLYIIHRMGPGNTGYNMATSLAMEGGLDLDRLEKTFRQLIRRQESLRTSFEMVNGQAVQKVHDIVEFKIEAFNRQGHEFVRPFDLSEAPLLRIGLVKIETGKHIFMFDMHHIISDGVSLGILIKEFTALYRQQELPPLRIQYKEFSRWQNRMVTSGGLEQQEMYWKGVFAGEVPVLDLPTDFPRPLVQRFEGSAYGFMLEGKEIAALKELAKTVDATLYMPLLSVYTILLSKLSGQEDIVAGTPIAGRRHSDLEPLIGMFVNTLALRNFPCGDKSYRDYLQDVTAGTLAAFDNQDYQFEDLVERLSSQLSRDAGRNPLFDVMFSFLNLEIPAINIPGLTLKPAGFERKNALFDLTLTARESGENLVFDIEYSTALFRKETMERFAGYYKTVTSVVTGNPDIKISEIEIIPEEEKQWLLFDLNDTQTDYPKHKTIHQLFEEQAERTPDHAAVIGAEQSVGARGTVPLPMYHCAITYKELNEKSNQLAHLLREKGVQPDTIVGLMIERSIEMIIGILGILKSGGAYLPIDPEYPDERKQYMLTDSGAKVLLTNLSEGHHFHHSSFINHHSGNLAYVIYTSGTTGKPKGTLTTHRNVVRVVKNTNYIDLTENDRVLQLSNYAFDGSVFDIYGALLNGAALVLVGKEEVFDVDKLSCLIERESITLFFVTTALFNTLVDLEIGCLKNVRKVLFGGERVSVEHTWRALEFLGKDRIIHMYGPTETTVYASSYDIDSIEEGTVTIPIGGPISRTSIYILNENLTPQPIGVKGEIYIGGDGLARGYLNHPELTAEKFVFDFYRSNRSYRTYSFNKIYRTGDLARWLPDGNIEFLGRIDSQVKIRGFRVELEEIENRLLEHEKIKDTVVVERQDNTGHKYLCGYISVTAAYAGSDLTGIKKYLRKHLPSYMVPDHLVQIDEIPLTPNGKVDRKKLPLPGVNVRGNVVYASPRNEAEEKLAEIWADLLGIDKNEIGIDDNFFELGGHSLKATTMVSRIQKELNVKARLMEIFRAPTIRDLAEHIKGLGKKIYSSIKAVEKKEYYPLSSAQERLYIIHRMDPGNTGYNMATSLAMEGGLDLDRLEKTFQQLIRRQESLRTSFEMVNGQAVQKVHDMVEFKIEVFNREGHEGHEFVRPFDLTQAPLLRVGLIKIGPRKHIFMFDMHHITADGISLGLLVKEFTALYRGQGLPLLPIQYKEFSRWQNHLVTSGALEQQEMYWKTVFAGEIPVLDLPTDFPRPLIQRFEGSVSGFTLGAKETAALKKLAKTVDTTLYMPLLSIYTILLSKLSGQENIVVGTPIAGRRHSDLEPLIGMFVNTLALCSFPSDGKTFMDYLEEFSTGTLSAFDNQDYQFEDLVERLSSQLNRDAGRNPLFDVMFSFLNLEIPAINIPGLTLKPAGFERKNALFDLTLTARESGENLVFDIEYSTALFKKETIERFNRYYKTAASVVTANPGIKISGIEIITEEEKQWLLFDLNDTQTDYSRDKTIHHLFEEQVERTPDGTAVVCAEQMQITYKKLNEKSNQLAHVLGEKGVGPNTIVGIMAERSVEMVIGILGILKAGGAYLPIDHQYPEKRVRCILKDSTAPILLTTGNLVKNPDVSALSPRIIFLEKNDVYGEDTANPGHINHPTDPVYIIYTSGTSGRPKGTMIEHRSLMNHNTWHSQYYEITEADHSTQYAGFGFDASVLEIFPYLTKGAALHIINEAVKLDILALKDYYVRHNITITFLPTQICQQFMEEKSETPSLRAIITGGEKLDRFVERSCRLYNNYGPTENTVVTTVYPVEKAHGNIPIGKPIYNNRVFILDKNSSRLQPTGVPGELCISGDSLARGYLNQPELTAEKFLSVSNRSNKSYRSYRSYISKKIYKTGDFARCLPDGNIEFLGRIDHQVKIRGFRIELAEIESHLRSLEGIKDAVVVERQDNTGHKYLCGYVSATAADADEIKKYLSEHLPSYMIPDHLVRIDEIPLTSSGKVNRNELPKPEVTAGKAYTPPRNEIDEKLVRVWSDVLGIEKEMIGIDSNFFELGGNSIKLMTISTRLNQVLPTDIPVVKLFTYPTIRALSSYLASEQKEGILGEDRSEVITSRRDRIKQRRNLNRPGNV